MTPWLLDGQARWGQAIPSLALFLELGPRAFYALTVRRSA